MENISSPSVRKAGIQGLFRETEACGNRYRDPETCFCRTEEKSSPHYVRGSLMADMGCALPLYDSESTSIKSKEKAKD